MSARAQTLAALAASLLLGAALAACEVKTVSAPPRAGAPAATAAAPSASAPATAATPP